MKNRKALKCTLGVVVVALFLAVTWSATAARLSVWTTGSSAVRPNPLAASSAPKKSMAVKALVQSAAVITTDKLDYHPGQRVTVSGAGWSAGETVTLSFAENPFIDGPHVFTTTADNHGDISDNQFVVDLFDGGITFTLTATGADSGQTATTTFTDADGQSLGGTGKVTDVTGNGGSCAVGMQQNSQLFNWKVVEGGSYSMTISEVSECSGDTITVFVQSSHTGNFCFNAQLDPNTPGTYIGTFTMPNPACFTMPISYKCGASQPCNNDSTYDAKGKNGEENVHLVASTFGANCTNPALDASCAFTCSSDIEKCADSGKTTTVVTFVEPNPGSCSPASGSTFSVGTTTVTCTSGPPPGTSCSFNVKINDCGPQGCICNPPQDITIECGTSTDPSVTGQGSCTGTGCTSSYEDHYAGGDCDAGGHTYQILTRTWQCKDATGAVISTCPQTITIRDTTPPTITTCPQGTDLGCNPASGDQPTCDSVKAKVVAHDTCSQNQVTLDCKVDDSDAGCIHTRKFTIKAKDACGNTSDPCVVTYTWKVDTTNPELHNLPSGGDLGCNPTPPTCSTTVTATDNCDGTLPVNCSAGYVHSDGCLRSQKFTYSAEDSCHNRVSQDVNYTWKVDTTPPVMSCPSNPTVQLYPGDTCPPSVTYTATANDNCDGPLTPVCSPPSGSTFPVGVTTVSCSVSDSCGNPNSCRFTITVYTSICVKKFYDENRNGLDDDGQVVSGWKMQLSGAASATKYTGADGTTCFTGLLPGTYTVTEVLPGSSWVSTTGTSKTFTNLICPDSFKFGNYCRVTNGFTIGYWGNNNGKGVLQQNDPAWRNLLNGLNLRKADGTLFTVPAGSFNTAYNAFASWLQGANATNMAYMLSAQLAATALNVAYKGLGSTTSIIVPGGVKTGANVCIVPFLSVTQAITCGSPPLLTLTASPGSTSCGCVSNNGRVTIGDLISRAVCLLGAYGDTTASGTARTYDECVKDILDMINNNGNPPGSGAYPCGGVINANGACAVVY